MDIVFESWRFQVIDVQMDLNSRCLKKYFKAKTRK